MYLRLAHTLNSFLLQTGQDSAKQLRTMMNRLPQHQRTVKMYATHMALAKQINEAYNAAVQKCNIKEQVRNYVAMRT